MDLQDAQITGQHLDLSYSDLQIQSAEDVNLAVGDRSVDLFLDPNHFPLTIEGQRINLCMLYGDSAEEMTVQRINTNSNGAFYGHGAAVGREASMEVYEMNDYQKTVAFLYLLGQVMNDGR